ncbi:porin [Methylobacillus gramineus]|uniref:porin n=1 Tax=Methylobacillus gramineus TaxID=755169 RepID=UPI001D000BE7|nr:porin [Methylobacillus gramineus]MCB5186013.1 porin [Methylobacillus gramineus]
MNKKLGLAVAGAVLAFSASAANAGIIIPAGDWTVDIGGNVNTYYTNTKFSGDAFDGIGRKNSVSTGLLPSALGIGAKTRQNDLDIAFQFTFFVGANSESGFGTTGATPLNGGESRAGDGNSINIRQAYLTFGDASWGTIKAGRDLGLFGSDAILSDMTLLGVGVGAGGPGNSTLGRIGSGYVYADWIGQIQYASPNWNGFSFAVAAREGLRNQLAQIGDEEKTKLGVDGKVSYEWTGDVSGKVWAGFISQKHNNTLTGDYTSRGYDVGGKINIADFGLVGYYYDGKGLDLQTGQQLGGLQFLGGNKSDDKGGYVQGTYKLPGVGTKLGLSYGISKSDNSNGAAVNPGVDFENKSWIVGAYHPLTKSLNLVAEYAQQKVEADSLAGNIDGKAKTISLGAILFF